MCVRRGQLWAAIISAALLISGASDAAELKFEHVTNIGTAGNGPGQFQYIEDFAFSKDFLASEEPSVSTVTLESKHQRLGSPSSNTINYSHLVSCCDEALNIALFANTAFGVSTIPESLLREKAKIFVSRNTPHMIEAL